MIDEHLAELTRQDEVPPEALVAAAVATAPMTLTGGDHAATPNGDPWSMLHRWGR
jgi:hypothetical protein